MPDRSLATALPGPPRVGVHPLFARPVATRAKASIAIETLAVLKGGIPTRALALALEWAATHRTELMENWHRCAIGHAPKRIAPLP